MGYEERDTTLPHWGRSVGFIQLLRPACETGQLATLQLHAGATPYSRQGIGDSWMLDGCLGSQEGKAN